MADHCSISKQSRFYSGKQELSKSGKIKKIEFRNLTFQKADRYYGFDLSK